VWFAPKRSTKRSSLLLRPGSPEVLTAGLDLFRGRGLQRGGTQSLMTAASVVIGSAQIRRIVFSDRKLTLKVKLGEMKDSGECVPVGGPYQYPV
jgi:hypothetical protein